MRKHLLYSKIKDEKGASTLIVLCVILILTALGTIALAASALNVRLSGRVMNWTREYYTLDTQAEKYVQAMDQQLIAAENDARTYVQGRYDKKPANELPAVFKDDMVYDMDYDPVNGAQAFFNRHYKEVWTRDTTGGAIEITLQDYLDDPSLVIGRSASYVEGSTTTEQAFSADVKKYTDELFDRIYFFMLSKRLTELSASTPGAISVEETGEPAAVPCTDKFTRFNTATWDEMAPNDGDVKLNIHVSNSNPEDPKEVNAQISIVKPHYETILKTVSTPVYGNPIWSNAITAGGNITINNGSSFTADGDVYASGKGGISINGGGDSVIRGNVYTQGDLAVTGDNGRLRVYSSKTAPGMVSPYKYDKKKLIYNNNYFFNTRPLLDDLSINVDYYSDVSGSGSGMPFFFSDLADWGNVYCGSLLVKEGVTGADIQVDGNVWTKDDIQMDGRKSGIRIGTAATKGSSVVPLTSYIGLNPFSLSDESGKLSNDPNTSSSVINNFPYEEDGTTPDSSIVIDSNFVVPGVAFYEFRNGPGAYQYGGKYYYKSAESVSARTTSPAAIISAYYCDGSEGVENGTFTSYEDIDFDLITPGDEINAKKTALTGFIASNGVKTNILTDLTDPSGYVAGAALLQKEDGADAELYTSTAHSGKFLTGSTQYLVDYSKLQGDALMSAFDSKTGHLGKTADYAFEDFMGKNVPDSLSEIIDRTKEGTFHIDSDPGSGIHEGIVYSGGDLTISGSGEFRGTIICRGNVTIEGSPTVIYDESVILGKLKAYKSVRDFFKAGNTENIIDTIHDYSSTSGARTVMKRYRITSWREKSV